MINTASPKVWEYYGCLINRKPRTMAGMRYEAYTPAGFVQGETLADVKRMIKLAVKKDWRQ